MLEWKTKGCKVCRKLWESGNEPPEVAVSLSDHSSLHKCHECGTLWEQRERFADVITFEEAKSRYKIE